MGTYAVNLAQFVVLADEQIYALSLDKGEQELFASMSQLLKERDGFHPVSLVGSDDQLGVVIILEGPALPEGELLAKSVGNNPNDPDTFHNNFQEPEKFIKAGGYRGRQHQVLVEGSYYINRLFATIEMRPKTTIEVGTVGVVVSYVGPAGDDSSGVEYKHGELVPKGCRGVWATPLLPGKYPFNPYSGKVLAVPTTNFILRWESATTGSHKFDENLKEVTLITKDAFEPTLPLSVVVHIDYKMAPMVVQRFGDIKKLVEQTLDPMVSAFFKNVAQGKTAIELLQQRSEIQEASKLQMRSKFEHYNLELLEVLIGTPSSSDNEKGQGMEQLLVQLRERQVAVEQVATYRVQEEASTQERSLRQAQAVAQQQEGITQSELAITVETNKGKATKARATLDAETVEITAKANSARVTLEGAGEASKILAIGQAEAASTKAKVDAFGGPQFELTSKVMTRFAEAIEKGKIAVVPQVQVGGAAGSDGESGGMGNNVMSGLMTMLMSERAGVHLGAKTDAVTKSGLRSAERVPAAQIAGKPAEVE